MAHCKVCGIETAPGRRFCQPCLHDHFQRKVAIVTALEGKHGKLSPTSHPLILKDLKRMQSLYKRDKVKFEAEMNKLAALNTERDTDGE